MMPQKKSNSVLLNFSYRTSSINVTDRILDVDEAFGIGLDDQREFSIFNNVVFWYNDADLIYVTGDSGSGKSTFLRIFAKHLEEKGVQYVDFQNIQPSNEETIIDGVGKDSNEAMELLASVGLGEAFLMLRKYRELSDGQKYRYRIAKLCDSPARVLIVDEFGANLDREMAKTLAYCLQKWARKHNNMVVISTTHRDLMEDFNPNAVIDKKFGQTTEVKYFEPKPKQFSLIEKMHVEAATHQDYELLHAFHYLQKNPAGVRHKYKLTYKGEPIAVILYTNPMRALALRNQLFPEYKNNLKRVNAEIERIARIVVHPKYRGIGLAHKLVECTLPLVNRRLVETIAAMAKYNPFFEKAGMTLGGTIKWYKEQDALVDFARQLGWQARVLKNPEFAKKFVNQLTSQQLRTLNDLVSRLLSGVTAVSPGRAEGLKKKLADGNFLQVLGELLPVKRVYLYWLNPAWQPQTRTPTPAVVVPTDQIN